MTVYIRTSAKAWPFAGKGAVAGRPATAVLGAAHPARGLAPRRVS
jgi:hypothetical protein